MNCCLDNFSTSRLSIHVLNNENVIDKLRGLFCLVGSSPQLLLLPWCQCGCHRNRDWKMAGAGLWDSWDCYQSHGRQWTDRVCSVFSRYVRGTSSLHLYASIYWVLFTSYALRWNGTSPYCDVHVIPIEITNKIKCNFINVFFQKIVTLQCSAIG